MTAHTIDAPTSTSTSSSEVSPEVFQQLGAITRLLHDTMHQLGAMPQLKVAADGIPDARSRLNYIAVKTAEAADKVLNTVDAAKAEQQRIAQETRRLAALIVADPVKAVASGALMNFVNEVEQATERTDQHLTDIMLAQDFQDLTGQVVQKVVTLTDDLEEHLIKLLVQVAPAEQAKSDAIVLNGPVVDNTRQDVVSDQSEVDDLLASLGF